MKRRQPARRKRTAARFLSDGTEVMDEMFMYIPITEGRFAGCFEFRLYRPHPPVKGNRRRGWRTTA